MGQVMPSQAAASIARFFPRVAEADAASYSSGHAGIFRGIVDLVREIPRQLLVLPAEDYESLVIGLGTIEQQLASWVSRGDTGVIRHEILRRIWLALIRCPDEYPPSSTTELAFIADLDLRENIRRDIGAVSRALENAEWKAANILAGAAIEALLHWKLNQPPPSLSEITAAMGAGQMQKPKKVDLDFWSLEHFIGMAAHRNLIEPETITEAKLAQNYRNLIHPGRSARLSMICDRGTALCAAGALEHVIRDLS